MRRIVPNTGGLYVTRRGDDLVARTGDVVATLRPAKIGFRIGEGVEVMMRYRPVDSPDELREALERINGEIADLDSKRCRLMDRLRASEEPTMDVEDGEGG